MKIYRSIYLLIFLSLFVTVASCGDKDKDEPGVDIPPTAAYDFVTVVESTEKGSVFEFQKSDDSPVITYTSGYDLASSSTHVGVGDRVIICYEPRDGREIYTSGPIRLYAYAKLVNTDQKLQIGTSQDYDDWATPPFQMLAFWRTGRYINMQTYLYVYKGMQPESFIMVADATTADSEMPVLYLLYKNKEGNDGENRYEVNASFDIKEIWEKPTCKGVIIKYPTPGGYTQTAFVK